MLFAPLLTLLLLQELPKEVAVRSHAYVPPQSALSAETNLVESTLVVRNNRDVPQGGFHASDFEVLDKVSLSKS